MRLLLTWIRSPGGARPAIALTKVFLPLRQGVSRSGFQEDTLTGFLETSASHDLLQFSTTSQTAAAQALLSNYAPGATNTAITDPQGDVLTINNHSIATFQNNLQDQVHLTAKERSKPRDKVRRYSIHGAALADRSSSRSQT